MPRQAKGSSPETPTVIATFHPIPLCAGAVADCHRRRSRSNSTGQQMSFVWLDLRLLPRHTRKKICTFTDKTSTLPVEAHGNSMKTPIRPTLCVAASRTRVFAVFGAAVILCGFQCGTPPINPNDKTPPEVSLYLMETSQGSPYYGAFFPIDPLVPEGLVPTKIRADSKSGFRVMCIAGDNDGLKHVKLTLKGQSQGCLTIKKPHDVGFNSPYDLTPMPAPDELFAKDSSPLTLSAMSTVSDTFINCNIGAVPGNACGWIHVVATCTADNYSTISAYQSTQKVVTLDAAQFSCK
jgi:hypothetical protein